VNDCISESYIRDAVGQGKCLSVRRFDCLPSTNRFLCEKAKRGMPEGLVVIAEHQTEGYGRYGRAFCSPEGTGLYMSILLRPEGTPEISLLITTAAAVAVSEAIEELTGRRCGIKWVNDLILDGKKVCGILTEGALCADSARLDYAVLGIGINVTEPIGGFPAEIRDVAGALLEAPEAGFRNRLATAILHRFFEYYRQLEKRTFFDGYRQRLFFLGKQVSILRTGQEIAKAIALDVDRDFRLLVRYDDGRVEALSSGEIGIKT